MSWQCGLSFGLKLCKSLKASELRGDKFGSYFWVSSPLFECSDFVELHILSQILCEPVKLLNLGPSQLNFLNPSLTSLRTNVV